MSFCNLLNATINISLTFGVMRVRTLKLAIAYGSIFVWIFLIVTDICLLRGHKCFPDHTTFKASNRDSLKSFQEPLGSQPDYEENV